VGNLVAEGRTKLPAPSVCVVSDRPLRVISAPVTGLLVTLFITWPVIVWLALVRFNTAQAAMPMTPIAKSEVHQLLDERVGLVGVQLRKIFC